MRRFLRGAALRRAALSLVLLTASQLAACSLAAPFATATPTPAPPTLACADHQQGQVDTVSHEITCIVAGAPGSQTGFWLYYTVADQQGHHQTLQGTCQGTLSAGHGACTQTYAVLVGQFDHPTASVAGILLPSQQALGPVSPAVIAP